MIGVYHVGHMECHQFQKFKKCMHFSIKVRALLQIVRALLQKVRALLQLCVHFYKKCVHFYKKCVHFYNCACTFRKSQLEKCTHI